jgi:acetyl/propionyl-CoA carboxylase alpha subunit
VQRSRHIEMQVFADAAGNFVHLFERECSIQRRHQKVVEESPSPALTAALRHRMGEAAIAAARTAGYQNAGTLEFLVEGTGNEASFYFLEMNTRLQVEHGVTEAVTGVDLVRAQLLAAMGERLPWRQKDLTQRGHAIECRVYAEDPASGFLPQAGTLKLYREPSAPGIRIDSGVEEGTEVPVQYDPMLAKVIASGESRATAASRARAALRLFPILGVRTNLPFLIKVLEHSAFVSGTVHTGFVEEHFAELLGTSEADDVVTAVAGFARSVQPALRGSTAQAAYDPWSALTRWGR